MTRDDLQIFSAILGFDPSIYERMANAILETIDQRGRCSILDLKAKGFSLDETARYWPQACELAEAKKHKTWEQGR